MQTATLLTSDKLAEIRQDVLAVAGNRTFELPDADCHVVGISGGNDSSAVALVMAALFPHIENLIYVFTDTGVEVEGTDEQIAKIEKVTGKEVIRITAGMSLFDLIEAQGSFLPSQRQRYCTKMSKIIPLIKYFDRLRGDKGDTFKIASYVGIRADEAERKGGEYGDGGTASFMPLQALGFERADVYKLVDKYLGIPFLYLARSRSGCEICIFSRRSEVLDRLENNSALVQRAAAMEGLPADSEAKLRDLPPSVSAQTGYSRNHLMMALPTNLLPGPGPMAEARMPWQEFRAKADNSTNLDLFQADQDTRTFFVAVQMHVGWLGAGSGYECYHQKLITYSTSLGGIKKAMKFYWEHRLNTMELMGVADEEELRNTHRIAIFEIALTDSSQHLDVNLDGVYTWQNDGKPLLLLKKTRYLLEQILLTEGLRQGLRDQRTFVRTESEAALNSITQDYGHILWAEAYEPPLREDLEFDIDIEDAPVACNICSR